MAPASLTIGDLARRTGLAVSAIRFYETHGILAPLRNAGGHRRYDRADIRRLSFAMIAQRGRIDRAEMEKTFNMGVGMIAVVAPEDTDRALAILTARHLKCWTLGTVTKGAARGKDGPRAHLVGQHPRF